MKYFVALFLLVCVSCKSIQPLKSNNERKPYKIITSLSFESAWSKIIDLCAENGLTFKIVSKSDGIMTIQDANSELTYEKKGKINDTTALAVAEKVNETGTSKYFNPTSGIVEWSIRVSSDDNDSTIIFISIVNPVTVTKTMSPGFKEKRRVYKAAAYSTGAFEKELESILK